MPIATAPTTSSTTTTTSGPVATDQPYVAFETTQIYLPADLATPEIQIVESGVAAIVPAGSVASSAAISGARPGVEMIPESAKYVNPFWWQEGVQNSDTFTTTTLSPEELAAKRERRRQRKERKRRRRRKHKHGDKHGESTSSSDGDEVTSQLRRRREVWNDKYYQEDNYAEAIFDASDVEPNIFNENDTKPATNIHYATDLFSNVLDRTDNNVENNLNGKFANGEKDVNQDSVDDGASDMGLSYENRRDNVVINDGDNDDIDVEDGDQIDQKSDSALDTDSGNDNFGVQAGVEVGTDNKNNIKKRRNNNQSEKHFVRHKRKSGKTTGALSRAKAGSSDSKSKSIDRHNKGGK